MGNLCRYGSNKTYLFNMCTPGVCLRYIYDDTPALNDNIMNCQALNVQTVDNYYPPGSGCLKAE